MTVLAPPMLASELWLRSQDNDMPDDCYNIDASLKFRTGVKAIDKELDGGFDYSTVYGITSRIDSDAADLVQGLLAAHLLADPESTANIIESTPFFDVRKLYHSLQSALPSGEEAMAALARLKISKVFDYQGMTEAVEELRTSGHQASQESGAETQAAKSAPRSTIADSDDEEDLLEAQSPVENARSTESSREQKPRHLFIVNSVSQVVGPAIQNNYAKGQAMLSVLTRAIAECTYEQSLCTFVLSSARSVPEDETLGILKVADFRPSVGIGTGYLLDVHVYLHQMLLRKPNPGEKGVTANVVSVVDDKVSNRFGRSAAFAYSPAGLLQDVA